MEASLLSFFFQWEGSPLPDAGNRPAEIGRLFRLRYNGATDKGRFTCTAGLFDTTYKLEMK